MFNMSQMMCRRALLLNKTRPLSMVQRIAYQNPFYMQNLKLAPFSSSNLKIKINKNEIVSDLDVLRSTISANQSAIKQISTEEETEEGQQQNLPVPLCFYPNL